MGQDQKGILASTHLEANGLSEKGHLRLKRLLPGPAAHPVIRTPRSEIELRTRSAQRGPARRARRSQAFRVYSKGHQGRGRTGNLRPKALSML